MEVPSSFAAAHSPAPRFAKQPRFPVSPTNKSPSFHRPVSTTQACKHRTFSKDVNRIGNCRVCSENDTSCVNDSEYSNSGLVNTRSSSSNSSDCSANFERERHHARRALYLREVRRILKAGEQNDIGSVRELPPVESQAPSTSFALIAVPPEKMGRRRKRARRVPVKIVTPPRLLGRPPLPATRFRELSTPSPLRKRLNLQTSETTTAAVATPPANHSTYGNNNNNNNNNKNDRSLQGNAMHSSQARIDMVAFSFRGTFAPTGATTQQIGRGAPEMLCYSKRSSDITPTMRPSFINRRPSPVKGSVKYREKHFWLPSLRNLHGDLQVLVKEHHSRHDQREESSGMAPSNIPTRQLRGG